MSKFAVKSVGTKTVNLAGGGAYKQSTKLEFISLLLTSFVQSQFYRTEQESLEKIAELYNAISDKFFIAKCAIYARVRFGMRSISHVVAGEIAKNVKGADWTKRFFDKVVYRVDDMCEVLAYYISKYGKPIPNSLKGGFANAFNKFNEYQLAKYRGENKSVSLIDVVNIVHPKGNEKNKEALKKLVNGGLTSFDTWESDLTRAGQNAKDENEKAEFKKNVWIKLVKENKIGYFALLRNLRNILEQANELFPNVCKMLVNEKAIKESLVLPFRFSTAIDEIEKLSYNGTRDVIIALSKAIEISLNNVPKFEGKTLVVLDESGSMQGKPIQIGSLFASILYKVNDAMLMTFAEDARFRTLNPMDSVMTIAKNLQRDFIGAGTDFKCIFPPLTQKFDRIIILSDMQGWIDYNPPTRIFNDYKIRTNANPFIYSFDLAGHGTLQFPEQNIFCLAGFSDKIFNIMSVLESDKNALINEIEKIEI